MAAAYRSGAARLAIVGEDPSLLAKQDTDKVSRANRARSAAYRPALDLIVGFDINWTIVSAATPAWASAVFPDLPVDVAVAKLWEAIFAASRADLDDPIGAWTAHNASLHARTELLNAKRYAALHFRGPATDLRVGLADDHEWNGGSSRAKNGVVCNANIPTEEVFTTPHKDQGGWFCAQHETAFISRNPDTRYRGQVRGWKDRRKRARTGEAVLNKVLETDEGSATPWRGGVGAELIADFEKRTSFPKHALR